jgi:hypothetical protein
MTFETLMRTLRDHPNLFAETVPESKAELRQFLLDYARFVSPAAERSVFVALDLLIPDDPTPA